MFQPSTTQASAGSNGKTVVDINYIHMKLQADTSLLVLIRTDTSYYVS